MDMMYPLMYIHGIYSNMLDKMYTGMSASWSLYVSNQRVLIVKSQPQFFAQIDSTDTDDGKFSIFSDTQCISYFEINQSCIFKKLIAISL